MGGNIKSFEDFNFDYKVGRLKRVHSLKSHIDYMVKYLWTFDTNLANMTMTRRRTV